MVTRILFAVLLSCIGLQRLAELRLSQKNERIILSRGGREYAPGQLDWMKFLHIAWFAGMLVEVFWLQRPFIPALSLAALLLLVIGQLLRYAAIRTLGWRWSVRVLTLPGAAPIHKGIYRYIRHPNYLGVMLEIIALPLIHTAYVTAFCFALAFGVLIGFRIREEESALSKTSNYQAVFQGLPRFLPLRRLQGKSDE
jgi:methyltransferase